METILLVKPFRENDIDRMGQIEGCEILYTPEPTEEQLKKATGMIGQPTAKLIAKAPNLRWIQSTSAGVDNFLAIPEIFERNIKLTNLSGAFGQSISEFALTMVMMLYKHLHLFRDHQKEHFWTDEGWQDSPRGKNVLILGAGNIGTETAKLFRVFDCHITGMRRSVREIPAEFDEMITMEGLDEALKKADIVISALPETPETHKLFTKERFMLMKKEALLINVGRGALIDCEALAEVLNEGVIAGAAVDVTDPEPLPVDHPLWDAKNAIVTPHITGGSFGHLKATEDRLFEICSSNAKRFAAGEELLNLVDPKSGYRVTENRF